MSCTPRTPFTLRFPAARLALVLALAVPALADDNYYYAGGKKYPLIPAADWIGVELTDGGQTATVSKEVSGAGLLRNDQSAVTHTPQQIMVLPVVSGETGKATSSATAGVKRAVRVFKNGNVDPIVETDDIIVRFKPDITRVRAAAILAARGVEIIREVGDFAPNAYLARVKNGRPSIDVANEIHETQGVVWSHPDLIWPMVSRFVPNDTLYPLQWHLNNTGNSGGIAGADIKAERAWEFTRGDPNIVIAIVDDGVATGHEDFASAGKFTGGWDFVGNDNDPRPGAGQNHGTACAGLAAADGNNALGVSGVAPNCRIMPVRLLGPGSTFSREAAAIAHAKNNGAAVISNSWGPADGTGASDPCPDVVNDAINDAADNGRGGKGCIITWAAGNGNESSDLDGYTSHPKVICVAATLRNDTRSPYSDFGAGVDVCAPGGSQAGDMVTVDRMGAAGYDSSNYTTGFNGTSAATPVVSGAVALLLSMEPNLTRTQVYKRLIDGADFVDTANATYDANGHNNKYGYGRVNIWRTLGWNDSSSPSVTISNITNNQTFSGLYAVEGTAADTGSGIYRVRCKVRNRNTNLWWQKSTGAWVSNPDSASAVQEETGEAGVWASFLPGMGEGNFEVQVQSEDKAGNFSGWLVVNYNIDNGAPTLTILQPASSIVSSSPAAISGTAADTGTGVKEVRVALRDSAGSRWWKWTANTWGDATFVWDDNATVASGTTSWSRALPPLAEGSYEVFAQALDNANDASEWKPRSFIYDGGNPVITFGSLVEQNPVFDFLVLGGTVSEPATVTWRLIEANPAGTDRYWTGTDWTTNGSDPAVWRPASVTGNIWRPTGYVPGRLTSRYGPYIAEVRAVDRASHLGEKSVVLIRTATDSTAPDLAFTSPAAGTVVTTTTLPPLTGTAADPESGITSVSGYLMRGINGGFSYWNGRGWTLTPTELPLAWNAGTWQAPVTSGINAWALPRDRDMVNGTWQMQVTATNGELPAGTRLASLTFIVDYYPIYTWTGGSNFDEDPNNNDNYWGNPDNWEPYGIPDYGDIAVIPGGTVESTVSRTVHALRMSGGSLTFTNGPGPLGTLTPTGSSRWAGGQFLGTMNIGVGATLTVDTTAGPRLNIAIMNIASGGTVVVTGTGSQGFEGTSSTINNAGNFRVERDGTIFVNVSTPPVFNNSGTFTKSAGTGLSDFGSFVFNNAANASLGAETGTLRFTGTITIAAGAQFIGAGTLQLASSSASLTGIATVSTNMELTGNTSGLDFGAGGTSQIVTAADGHFRWNDGSIYGVLTIPAGSRMDIDTSAVPTLQSGAVLNNSGTITLSGAVTTDGTSQLDGTNSTINNLSGGRFEIARDGLVFRNISTPPTFNNTGLLVKTAGAGISDFGSFVLINSGTVNVPAAATLRLTYTTTLHNGTQVTGAGKVLLENSSVSVDGGVAVLADTTLEMIGNSSAIYFGTTGASEISTAANARFRWKDGSIYGVLGIPAGSRMEIDTSAVPTLQASAVLNNAGTIVVSGAVATDGSSQLDGTSATINNLSGGRVEVARDGLVFQNISTPPVIKNQAGAVFVKTVGAGSSMVGFVMDNDGTVEAAIGSMNFFAGSSAAGSTGVFHSSAAAARVEFGGGTHIFKTGARFTGPGRGRISGGGAVTLSGAVEVGSAGSPAGGFELTGNSSSLNGGAAGSLSVVGGGGTFAWDDGTIATIVAIGAGARMELDTSAVPQLGAGGVLNNDGIVVVGGVAATDGSSQLDGTSSTINNSGRFEIARDGLLFRNISTPPTFHNTGLVVKTAGTGVSDIGTFNFANSGGLSAPAGTTLRLTYPATLTTGTVISGAGKFLLDNTTVTIDAPISILAGATFEMTGNSAGLTGAVDAAQNPLATVNGPGSFSFKDGTVFGKLNIAANASFDIDTTAGPAFSGATINNAGTARITGPVTGEPIYGTSSTFNNLAGARLEILRGGEVFRNSSTPPILSNAGTFVIGSPLANINMSWNFTQSASGSLNVDVAGPGAAEFDHLAVAGSATLGGTVNVTRLNGYTPAAGTTFAFVTAGSVSGTFGLITGGFAADYTATTATLRATAIALSFDAWAAANGLTGANALPNADFDKDGLTNFAEYVFNTDPKAPGGAPQSTGTADIGGQKWLTLNYRRWTDREAAGVVYSTEAAAGLGGWNSAGVIDEVDPNAPQVVGSIPCRCRVLIGGVAKFLRVKAAKP